jgi:flagellar M-ring protein FliF
MAAVNDIVEQVRAFPLKKQVALLAVFALLITGVILMFTWMQKADYQLLFANLSDEDAGQIIQKLNEQKVPYRTNQSGIMVPADKVYELRLQLASQGIPQGGGVGFEIFDKSNFAMTDFVQKLNYSRALQGELARTIRALSEIEQCRVHLAAPEKSLFAKEHERPKASVLVKLKQGRRLSQGQVQGIVHLVSSSVDGLDPKDVAVVDNRGEMLTSPSNDAAVAGMTNDQLEFQRNYEKEIEGKIVSIFEPVLGKNKVRAKVAATLDFSRVEKTEEKFDPDGQVVRSEQRNNEKSTSGMTGGIPGVASNIPGRAQPQSGSQQGQSEKKNETINYEISKITSHTINSSGEVKRLSVVVLVDGTYTAQQGSKEKKYAARTEDELKQFEDMVKKAVGFFADRGDEVRVVNMPFEGVSQEELSEPKMEIMPVVMTAGKYVVPLIALVLLFLFVIRPLIKTVTAPSGAGTQSFQIPQTVAEIEKAMEKEEKTTTGNVIDWSRKNPKEAANIIKTWLEER